MTWKGKGIDKGIGKGVPSNGVVECNFKGKDKCESKSKVVGRGKDNDNGKSGANGRSIRMCTGSAEGKGKGRGKSKGKVSGKDTGKGKSRGNGTCSGPLDEFTMPSTLFGVNSEVVYF